uniref:KH domain-containing protein n=1 Tax=Angiostrongylus cantonensis TaxID=6313 RepID=A0A0K0DMI1_ANGCA
LLQIMETEDFFLSHREKFNHKQLFGKGFSCRCILSFENEYNFVGRILGPRGMTAKQLEEDTGCKIMVRGRGSSRTVCFFGNGSRRDRSNDTEPLHVLIQCEDYEKRAHQKMRNAVEAVNQLLHPPVKGKDELKRKQLIELSIINGTYRPTSTTKVALRELFFSNGSFKDIRLFTNHTITEAPRPLSASNLPSVTFSEFATTSLHETYLDTRLLILTSFHH